MLQAKVVKMYEIREDLDMYWNKYPKEKFRKILRSSEDTKEAYDTFTELLEQYSNCEIRDDQIENHLWCLESAFKAGLIIVGKREVDLELFERIFDLLGVKEMSKFELVKEAKHRLEVCHGLIKWAKRIKGGLNVNFEEMKRSYREYKELCKNIDIGESLDQVKKSISLMEKLIKRTDRILELSELKEIRDKMRMSSIVSDKELASLEKRIFQSEKFVRKISSMTEEEMSTNFESLNADYQVCQIKVSKFEEVLQKNSKEEYFVKNVSTILEEPTDKPLERIRSLRDEYKKFTFCRYCEVELLLANKEVEVFHNEWQRLEREGHKENEIRNKIVTAYSSFGIQLEYFEKLETDLTELRDKIRQEIHNQISRRSKRTILCDIMKYECDKLQSYLIFLRILYGKKDGLKSGKTSVFEKSLECFLENYKQKPVKSNTSRNKQMKEEDLRKYIAGELRKILETMTIFDILPTDVPFVASSIEQGIFVKLLEKSNYEIILKNVMGVLISIKKYNLIELARYIKKSEFHPKILIKLSQKSLDNIQKTENKLIEVRDNKRRNNFAKKYLAPFEDDSLIQKKIKKLKPMEEFDGYSIDERDQSEDNNRYKRNDQDVPYIPPLDIDDKESILAEDDNMYNNSSIGKGNSINMNMVNSIPIKKIKRDNSSKQYQYSLVHSGSARIDVSKDKRKVDIYLYSCAAVEFIRHFSQIPIDIGLSNKIQRKDFVKYIDKALITENK